MANEHKRENSEHSSGPELQFKVLGLESSFKPICVWCNKLILWSARVICRIKLANFAYCRLFAELRVVSRDYRLSLAVQKVAQFLVI